MKQYEEYKQTELLGGYKPEEVQGRLLGDEKIVPFLCNVQCAFEKDKLELHRQVYVGGRIFKVTSVFKLFTEKTATDSMLRLIDHDLEK